MKDVQCNELFGGIAPKNHAFHFSHDGSSWHMHSLNSSSSLVWPCYGFVDGLSYRCINVYKKK